MKTNRFLFAVLLLVCSILSAHADVTSNANGNEEVTITDIKVLVNNTLGKSTLYNDYHYVNLGLSSNLLWATCNVGAEDVTDSGYYFAWGETEEKDAYNWNTYTWGGSTSTLSRYCVDNASGTVDNITTLFPENDAARAYMGAHWRTPTLAEYQELFSGCDWYKRTINGVPCIQGISKKNQRSITFPLTGYIEGDSIFNVGYDAAYWTSNLYSDCDSYAYSFYFSKDFRSWAVRTRQSGHTIRAVTQVASKVYDLNGDNKVSIADIAKLMERLFEKDTQEESQ